MKNQKAISPKLFKKKFNQKAISPLIATVLLIGFTMAVAAILASWATTFSAARIAELEKAGVAETKCRGGVINFISGMQNPKIENNKIIAIIEVANVPLGNFSFDIILANASTLSLKDTTGLSLASGKLGTIISEYLGVAKENIAQLRVSSNCTDVKSTWKTEFG